MKLSKLPLALWVATLLISSPIWAGEGHDHGGAAPTTVGAALPRFAAESEIFELVGVLSGKQITLYLDQFADNSPVRDAQIELEIGGAKFKAEPQSQGEYKVMLPEIPKAGVLPVTATVTTPNESDLLAGELDIHEPSHTEKTAHTHSWKEYAGWAVVGVALLALLVWSGRRLLNARSVRTGGAA